MLAVVLFHAGIPGVGGGYIGVDVFFVISGFLITGLLWREVTDAGTVRLGRFYGARARRLLPAATTVGVATSIGAALLLPPLQARTVLGDGIASALYVGNYRFAMQGTDYLAADGPPSPFQHYWSLGVEEQFYLLWPALIIGTAWLIRRIRLTTRLNPYLVVLAAVGAVSFALSVAWTRSSPPWAFFSLPTRAWELAAGGLVALSADRWQRLPSAPAAVAGWGGLALIVLSCIQLGTGTPYPGTAALLPVLGTALVIGGGAVTAGAGPAGCCRCRRCGRSAGVVFLVPVALAGAAADAARVAHRRACRPSGRQRRVGRGRGAHAASGREPPVGSLPLCDGRPRAASPSPPPRPGSRRASAWHCCRWCRSRPATGRPPGRPNAARCPGSNHSVDPNDTAVEKAFAQAQAAVAARPGSGRCRRAAAVARRRAGRQGRSVLQRVLRWWREVGHAECATGVPRLGDDSGAGRRLPRRDVESAVRCGRSPVNSTGGWKPWGKITCPLMNLPITSYLGREYSECLQWRDQIIARLQAEHPKLIVLSMSRRYGADFGFTSYDPAWIDSLSRTVTQLRATGAKVLVLGPIPDPHHRRRRACRITSTTPGASTAARAGGQRRRRLAAELAATAAGGGQYADLTPLFCTAERCPVIISNQLVYRYDNHVPIEYAQTLGPVLGALADRALARG